MRLKVLLPYKVLLDIDIEKLTVDTLAGSHGFLPHHIDYVVPLVPGILSYTPTHGEERFLANDEGLLVKCGDAVRVSVRQASESTSLADLDHLQTIIDQDFKQADEEARQARSAFAQMEARMMHNLMRT